MSAKPIKSKVFTPAVAAELKGLWDTMKVTDPRRFQADLAKIKNGRGMYGRIGASVNVPWWFIAVIHGLECSYNFEKHLHNGDSLRARTVNVPAGRPAKGLPPFSFFDSAVDALTMPGKQFHLVKDWSIPHALWLLENYNGLGYRLYKGVHTPYLWAGTNHYVKGKYVRDGVYDANVVSKQCGTAGLLSLLFSEGIA